MMNKNAYAGLLIVMAILAVLPFVLPNSFYLDLAIRMAINAVIVLGLNLLIGFAGQISLGHAGFLGIGAYASAALPTHFGWHPLLAMGAGAAAAGLLAALVARPIFKLKGHYLAMATLGLGIILSIAIRNEAQWTGGPDGMPVLPLGLFGFELANDRQWYWAIALLLSISVWASLCCSRSACGPPSTSSIRPSDGRCGPCMVPRWRPRWWGWTWSATRFPSSCCRRSSPA